MIGTAGDTGSAGQRLGACPACDVQTVGSRISTVPSPTRLPLRHVVRVSHGEHSSQSILYGLLLRTNLNRVSRWCLQVHHQSCGFFDWVSWWHLSSQGLLFKVNGVSSTSATYGTLAAVMFVLCVTFVLCWLYVAGRGLVANLVSQRRRRGPVREQWSAVKKLGVDHPAQSAVHSESDENAGYAGTHRLGSRTSTVRGAYVVGDCSTAAR